MAAAVVVVCCDALLCLCKWVGGWVDWIICLGVGTSLELVCYAVGLWRGTCEICPFCGFGWCFLLSDFLWVCSRFVGCLGLWFDCLMGLVGGWCLVGLFSFSCDLSVLWVAMLFSVLYS